MKKIFIFLSLSFLLFFGIAYSAINVQAFTNEKYDVTIITLVDGSKEDIATLEDQDYGSSITPISSTQAPEGFEFSFWIVNNIVRKDLESDHTFFVTATLEITAVFEPIDNSKHAVLFMDSNGRFIEGRFVENGGTVGTPSTLGYSKPNYVVADEPWKDTDGNIAVFENITESKVFVLQYKPATEKVVEISVNGDEPVKYAYNEIVTVSSDLAGFTHWEEDGVIVSYKKDYSFTALANRNLVAKNDGTVKPLVSLLNVTGIREDYKSFLGQFYLPEGYTLIEAGILASNDEKVLFIDSTNTTIVKSNSILETTNEFLRSFPEDSFTTFRGYVVVKDSEDEIKVIYSDNNYFFASKGIEGATYTETFANLNLGGSYKSGSFIGVNGQEWTYTDSRGDEQLDGKALTIRGGSLKTTFTNGLSHLEFDYKRAFTNDDARNFEVYINNVLIDKITVIANSDTLGHYLKNNLSYEGTVELEIKGTGNQKLIDNIIWSELSEFETEVVKLYSVEFNIDEEITFENVINGHKVQQPELPTKLGFIFDGWYENKDFSGSQFDFDIPINKHIKLFAKFIESTDPITHEIVYKFKSKSWGADYIIDGESSGTEDWTTIKDGNQFISGQGIQVTAGVSGASGKSKSFQNIVSIEIFYATNSSKGAGTITTNINSNEAQKFTVSTNGGTTPRSAGIINVDNLTGNITIMVTCTTNSIYIHSVKIKYMG